VCFELSVNYRTLSSAYGTLRSVPCHETSCVIMDKRDGARHDLHERRRLAIGHRFRLRTINWAGRPPIVRSFLYFHSHGRHSFVLLRHMLQLCTHNLFYVHTELGFFYAPRCVLSRLFSADYEKSNLILWISDQPFLSLFFSLSLESVG